MKIKIVSHWFAWISFGSGIVLLMKFVARKSKRKRINLIFSKSHRIFAAVMFVSGLLHGVISFMKSRYHIMTFISGILLTGTAVYVCLAGIHRNEHKKTWMKMHRMGSIIFAFLLAAHLVFALLI